MAAVLAAVLPCIKPVHAQKKTLGRSIIRERSARRRQAGKDIWRLFFSHADSFGELGLHCFFNT